MGGATVVSCVSQRFGVISIHAPRGGSDSDPSFCDQAIEDFNPRSPWGERPVVWRIALSFRYFNPRSPWGERLLPLATIAAVAVFQSTLPVGGATLSQLFLVGFIFISIHAPRGGSDGLQNLPVRITENFNPRSPWGERLSACPVHSIAGVFQSTLPVGGATASSKQKSPTQVISIHAPRGGSDAKFRTVSASTKVFQSTLPVGGATFMLVFLSKLILFQSTLPVGGATFCRKHFCGCHLNFNPRSPWGERLSHLKYGEIGYDISIHAPRGGSDHTKTTRMRCFVYFNPRSPWGERRAEIGANIISDIFQSTLPVGGATSTPD